MTDYKGYTITLITDPEGYNWQSKFVITKLGETVREGYPDGDSYDSPQAAEDAALKKAKSVIDEGRVEGDDDWA
jgi:hypothetical protein